MDQQLLKALLTAKEVAKRTGVSIRTIWRWNASGELPAPVRLGRRIVRWKVADIDRFIAALPGERKWGA